MEIKRLSRTGLSKTAFRLNPGRAVLVLGTFPSLLSESYLKAVVWVSKHLSSKVRSKGFEVEVKIGETVPN